VKEPHGHKSRLRVKEQDSDPTVEGVREIRVPNASVTDEGKGIVSLAYDPAGTGDAEAAAHVLAHAGDDDAHHAVFIAATHTAIGDSAPHHARYTDAEAIAAVQAEATLDLTGDVTVAANKTLAADHLIEKTAGHGIVLDGVELKDDAVETDAIRGLRETSGPTSLTVGTITDGEYLKRVGATVVSGTPAGGGSMATDPIWAAAGDIPIGTANDQGEILTVSVPGAANLLSVVGTVTGDTKPGYKVLFDGTAPEPVGTAAAGTGVVAAHRNHVHAGKVTHCMVFNKTGSLINATPLTPQGLCVGESGEHGTFTAIRGKATCTTVATVDGTTVIIQADDNPAFSSATTLFTLTLNTGVQEFDDTALDNAWAAGDIWIRAYCSGWNAGDPQDVKVQFYFTEAVWA
jgi:hypothetical protein